MNWYALEGFARQLLSAMADASLSAIVLAASAAILILFLRRNSVARHALWAAVMIGMLALPVLRLLIPAAYLHVPHPLSMDAVAVEPDLPMVADTGNTTASIPHARSGHPAWRPGWPEYIAIVYLAGVGLLGARLLLGLFFSRRLLRGSRAIGEELWQHFDKIMAAGCEVQLEESNRLRVPVTTGIHRVRVILPAEWRTWPQEKLEAVLAHELAHARRRDPLISLIAAVNKYVFWFHPLSWWLERRLALLAEHAADDAALATSQDAQSYARIVLEIASSLQQRKGRLIWHDAAANRAAMTGPMIAQRIRRIMYQQSRSYVQKLGRFARIMLLSGAVLLVWISTTVDFQSVARAQEKQESLGRGDAFVVFTHPGKPQSQDQPRSGAASDENFVAYLADGEDADAKPLTDEQAAEQEGQLVADPEDEQVRERLLRHYWQRGLEDKRTALILWLIDHHPESSLHGRQTAHIFASGSHESPVGFADAKSRWVAQVNQHPENATIIGNAARVMNESSLTEGIALMKRAQALDPAHRTQPLAWLYSIVMMDSLSRPAPKNPEVMHQIRGDLQASNDILLVGSVARSIARMSVPTPTRKNQLKTLAIELLKHAETLEPQNQEWPALLRRVEGTRDLSEQPPISIEPRSQLMRVSKEIAANALLQSEIPDYPPEVQAIRVRGNVILQVRIGKDGRVIEAKAISGHPRLVPTATDAVKRYVYKPFMLDGNAVDVSTIVEVTFRE